MSETTATESQCFAWQDQAPDPFADSLEGCRAVVTGGAGFIGSTLVDALLARHCEVVVIDRRDVGEDEAAALNLRGAIGHRGLSVHRLDLAVDDLDEEIAGADTVFHLAALPGVRSSWGSEFFEYVENNIYATYRLLDACERTGVRRLVYASSSSVYGDVNTPCRERDATGPISPYGVTKLAAENLCIAHAARQDSSLSVQALRFFTAYGPRQRPGMAIGRALMAALTGTKLRLFGEGDQRREFTYIDDIVAATMAASTSRARPAVLNVGGGSSASMLEILDLASQITGKKARFEVCRRQPGDVMATRADLTRAREHLGYRPTVDLYEGMLRQFKWLESLSEEFRVKLYRDFLEGAE